MSHQTIAEQAAQWIEDVRTGRASSEALFAWLKESPRHVEEMLMISTAESALSDLGRSQPHELQSLLQRGMAGAQVVPLVVDAKPTGIRRVGRTGWWLAAA